MKKPSRTKDNSPSTAGPSKKRKPKAKSNLLAWSSVQFVFTNEEWAHLRTLKVFEGGPTGNAVQARQFLNSVISAYCRDSVSYLSAREAYEVLKEAAKHLKQTQPQVDRLSELSNLRQGFQSFDLLGPGYPLALNDEKFQEFREFVNLVDQAAKALPPAKGYQQTQKVRALVQKILQVLSYTSGDKRLRRSSNYGKPVGKGTGTLNDKDFVKAIFEMAQKRTNIKIGNGSIDEAMKKSISKHRKKNIRA